MLANEMFFYLTGGAEGTLNYRSADGRGAACQEFASGSTLSAFYTPGRLAGCDSQGCVVDGRLYRDSWHVSAEAGNTWSASARFLANLPADVTRLERTEESLLDESSGKGPLRLVSQS